MPLEEVCKTYMLDYLVPVAAEIDKLTFKEDPNYNYLVFLLEKSMMDRNICPQKEYNWILDYIEPNGPVDEKYDDVEEDAAATEVYY